MNFWTFLFLYLLLVRENVLGNPHLLTRDEDTTAPGSASNLVNGFGAAGSLIYQYGKDLLDGTDYNNVKDLLIPPKTTPPITDPSSEPPAPALNQNANPTVTYPLSLPLDSKDCDENSPQALRDECQAPSPKIVYAIDCNENAAVAEATNDAVTQVLKKEVLRNEGKGSTEVQICSIPRCGVLFWAADLTPAQMLRIGAMPGVRGFASDSPILSADDPSLVQGWSDDLSGGLHEKRAVVSKSNEYKDLAFLSTALGETPLPEYHYFEEAGEGITGYVVGPGMRAHEQIPKRQISRWLFGLDAGFTKTEPAPDFTGTCDISKLIGPRVGVVSKAQIVVVKVAPSVKGFLSGLTEVIGDLQRRSSAGEKIPGFNVLQTSLHWEDRDEFADNIQNKSGLRTVLMILFQTYQLPIVVPAGNARGTDRRINTIPAKLATDQFFPLITVGASNLFGQLLPFSTLGSTISAPGLIQCASFEQSRRGYTEVISGEGGTGAASVVTAGLAIYFCSIEEVRNNLLAENKNFAAALRDYISLNGYVRTRGNTRAVWNGLDPTKPNDNYGWTY